MDTVRIVAADHSDKRSIPTRRGLWYRVAFIGGGYTNWHYSANRVSILRAMEVCMEPGSGMQMEVM